jgi:hypothetical protein
MHTCLLNTSLGLKYSLLNTNKETLKVKQIIILNDSFEGWLPCKVKRLSQQVYDDLDLEWMSPVVYPSLQDLYIGRDQAFVSRYKLCKKEERESRETDRLPAVAYASV